ncbi:MAG: hypothetical protein IKW19_00410 [Akkermansia sp.]|nr:hypothetical protein [Akkermansia sp.]
MMNVSKTNQECIETLKMVDVSPIATPAHLATITQMIVDQVSERMKTLAVTQTCGVKTEWASMAQLAQIFGVCRRTMDRMMQEVLRKHDVQVIQATDYIGNKGHRRYRIADVEKALMEENAA